MLMGYRSCINISCELWWTRGWKQIPSHLTSRRDINGDQCDFWGNKFIHEQMAGEDTRCNNIQSNCWSHANNALAQPLWKSIQVHSLAHSLTHTHTRNLTTTSPVSRSLIKLTGAGPPGQAKTSEPSPSCHGMMDLSSTGCQAATQVHCPVGLHQQTLGRHPVDLICIYTPLLHVKGSFRIGSASSPTLSTCEWMY